MSESETYDTKWNGVDVVLCDPQKISEVELSNQNAVANSKCRGIVNKRESTFLRNNRVSYHATSVCADWRRSDDIRSSEVPTIDQIKSWDFDVLLFSELTLIPIAEQMLDYFNIYEKFSVDRIIMNNFIQTVIINHPDATYADYHNCHHAVATMHMVFVLLTLADAQKYLQDFEIYALLVGGLAHDVNHTGQNNDYHIKVKSDLALQYNNVSVLENNSVTKTRDMWNKDEATNILSGCNHDERLGFEEYFQRVILHTDPAKHGEMTHALAEIISERVDRGLEPFDVSNQSHRILIGEMIVHASDISSPSGPDFMVVQDWSQRVIMEFRKQTVLERMAGVEVTSYMDGLDDEGKVAQLQADFCNFMLLPLIKMVSVVLPNAALMEKNLLNNIASYLKIVEGLKDAEASEKPEASEKYDPPVKTNTSKSLNEIAPSAQPSIHQVDIKCELQFYKRFRRIFKRPNYKEYEKN